MKKKELIINLDNLGYGVIISVNFTKNIITFNDGINRDEKPFSELDQILYPTGTIVKHFIEKALKKIGLNKNDILIEIKNNIFIISTHGYDSNGLAEFIINGGLIKRNNVLVSESNFTI